MKVRIGQADGISRTYSPEDVPIELILDERDKTAIAVMPGRHYAAAPRGFDLEAWIDEAVRIGAFDPLASSDDALRAHWHAFVERQDRLAEEWTPLLERALTRQGHGIAAAVERGDDPALLTAGASLLMEPVRALYAAVVPAEARLAFEAIEEIETTGFRSWEWRGVKVSSGALRQIDDDLLFQWDEAVVDFLQNEGARNVTRINATTRQWLSAFLAEAAEEGWGPVAAARELRKRWPEPGGMGSKARAERIARTELLGAMNRGSLLGADAVASRLGLDMRKSWLATLDSKVRPDHADAHGQQVGLHETFNVGGWEMEHPGDQSAGASQTANCRCTLTFEVVPT